jgi:glucan biosynthesis protein C
MKLQTKSKNEREYFIDWLRIGLIISVFFFHIGMIFNTWHWHVKNEEIFYFLEPIMYWLHLWRMPLLFLVSGVGTFYALGFRTTKQYLKERFTRLFVPFIIGIFILVPIQVYIEKITEFSSLGNLYINMFDGVYPAGNFSWHHLWFILYLLVISLIISPFIEYTRSGHFNMVRGKLIAKVSKRMGLNWLFPIILISQLILRQYYPNNTHALYNDWAFVVYYLLFFLSGFILFTSNKVIQALTRDRRLYLLQTIVFTIILFVLPTIFGKPSMVQTYSRGITEMLISLSCGLAVIGYCKVYFNRDHKFRKILNTAIYPFYLLHQPIIVVVGYVILQWQLPVAVKAILITLVSLSFTIGIYWVISKFNVLRIVFGMKKKSPRKTLVPQITFVNSQGVQLEPILTDSSLIIRK